MLLTSFIRRQLAQRRVRREIRCLCSSQLSLADIRSQLCEYKGGEVSLTYAGKENCLAIVNVSHPERKNAFTGSMCVSLYDKIQELRNDKTQKAVVLRGMNKMFCSGADLTMAKQIADPINGERFSFFMQTTLSQLRNLPFPSYAVIQGNVLGGGTELMVACDVVIANRNTDIYFVQGKMGIVPGWAGATHLVGRVGYHRALTMLLSGQAVNSAYAHSVGLVDHLLESTSNNANLSDEDLLTEAVEVIEAKQGHLPAEVIHGIKSVTINASRLSYSDSISNERQVFKSLWGGPANLHALHSKPKHVKD